MIRQLLTLSALLLALSLQPGNLAAQEELLTLTRDIYYDKTLAGILGQVGGFLSGYEFLTDEALPDEWFRLTYGPYSGDSPYHSVTDFHGYDRLFSDGRVGGDDDYHVDFFNQLVLDEYGPNPTYWDIRQAWVEHQVGDWGGGDVAMQLMNEGMLPPLTGLAEYNRFYWVSEPYIETETLGMVAPGMPQTARTLTNRFARVVGDFDSVIWGEFWATMYAIAYFETDARVAMEKAAIVLPADSWPYQIYQRMVRLHAERPEDWRWAQQAIQQYTRPVYRVDNPLVIADMNNAMGIMAILYGENDYMLTAQIASLSGYDADCTAAAVLGLMGILNGMSGTPEEILTRVYADGDGVYINDLETGYPTFIGYDYPAEQRWTELAALYQRNAEQQIVAQGGRTEGDTYVILPQTLLSDAVISIPNADFEYGTLEGWMGEGDAQFLAEANTRIESGANMAHSGDWKGVVLSEGGEAQLAVQLENLTPGTTYRASAYVQSDEAARFFVAQQENEPLWAGVVSTINLPEREWVRREIEFVASNSQARVGLWVPPGVATRAAIDNLFVRPVASSEGVRYEAEDAVLNGVEVTAGYVTAFDAREDTITFSVRADQAGEHTLIVRYANGGEDEARVRLVTNGEQEAVVWFPRTGGYGEFSHNQVEVPVVLVAGDNEITLTRRREGVAVDVDAIEVQTKPF